MSYLRLACALMSFVVYGCGQAATLNVIDFGAAPNDGIDDREAIQTAIYAAAGGGKVFIPSGTYVLSKSPDCYCNLNLDGVHGLTIEGEHGTVLMQEAGIRGSTRLIAASTDQSSNITIQNIILDGNKENQDATNKQRHGLFFGNSENLTFRNIESRNFTGDGIYIYVAVESVVVDNVNLYDNGRNGLTIGGYVTGLKLTNSMLVNNEAQQFDSEGDIWHRIDDVSIIGNTFISPHDYAITLGGSDKSLLGRGWRIIGNRIESGGNGVRILWADGLIFSNNNVISGNGSFSGVQVYQTNKGVVVNNNTIFSPSYSEHAGVSVIATGGGSTDFVTISENQIDTRGGDSQTGIRIQGASNAIVTGNHIISDFTGTSLQAAIFIRSTKPVDALIVSHNVIRGPHSVGVRISAGPDVFTQGLITDNIIFDTNYGVMVEGSLIGDVCAKDNQTVNVVTEVSGIFFCE